MNMTKGTTKHGFGLMVVFGDGGGLVVLMVFGDFIGGYCCVW